MDKLLLEMEVVFIYKLIIVEDEYEIRLGLANYFPWKDIGFEVVGQFENGKECLNYISKNHVDTVLCDIKMPVMSGLELAKVISESNINVKMVIISGYTEFEYARQALRYGVKDYIVKPTKYSEIVEVFNKIKRELDSEQYDEMKAQSKNETIYESGGQGDIISIIKKYIKENYKDATLEDAAKIVYMNPYYLSKFFKQKTGKNFSDYLTEVKMKKAADFLKNPLYKTYEVSSMVGYKNPKNFTRAFKKFYRKSPREYVISEK
ncbi:response regulator [Thermoanaerobacterium sp. RBIITD]|uniref:response regulator transcription factor n=1 Tax=Thermoanaerobacterium sp. RBIITD TaxID=1550240 RepID=UPI000BBFE478|nr:response regulator [Thermoanaerobacterium sp. RBIITD]SNX53421.1 Helix-turn-helix domain-containing protein [Thermoanaerobacterium sp. RBIITD]